MGKEKNNRSIAGEWLGNYYYSNSGQSFGFEAVFIETNGDVQGNILDDGHLGEARITGTYSCPQLNFTKIYRHTEPVKYEGTLSDDGNCLTGKWHINEACHGSWTAYRQSEDEDEDIIDVEQEEDVEVERPLTAPAKSR